MKKSQGRSSPLKGLQVSGSGGGRSGYSCSYSCCRLSSSLDKPSTTSCLNSREEETSPRLLPFTCFRLTISYKVARNKCQRNSFNCFPNEQEQKKKTKLEPYIQYIVHCIFTWLLLNKHTTTTLSLIKHTRKTLPPNN